MLHDHLADLDVPSGGLVKAGGDGFTDAPRDRLTLFLGALVYEQDEQRRVRVMIAIPSVRASSSIVLPARASATMSARCPYPIDDIRSMQRLVSSGPPFAGRPV